MNTFIILLRGVTPTGKNKVLMAPLRTALSKAGLKDVQAYIQSGNVIATSSLALPEVEKLVNEVIYESFGSDSAVLARTPEQLSEILKCNPFIDADGKRLYYSLLSAAPDKKRLEIFLSIDFSPDQVRFVNNTIYTLYATKHSDSKLNNNYFERKLRVTATTRNFNTMTKLVALTVQGPPAEAKRGGCNI